MTNPGGTGRPARVVLPRLSPLPPTRVRSPSLMSLKNRMLGMSLGFLLQHISFFQHRPELLPDSLDRDRRDSLRRPGLCRGKQDCQGVVAHGRIADDGGRALAG